MASITNSPGTNSLLPTPDQINSVQGKRIRGYKHGSFYYKHVDGKRGEAMSREVGYLFTPIP